MIVLVGCSGSGKSTIQSYLTKMYGFESLISYTTRQPRDGEKDGIDYHFISEEEFLKKKEEGFFAEIGKYREWLYGSAKEDCTNNKVAVLTPHGLRQMKRIPELDVVSFYIDVPRRERMVKVLERGDDIEETKRRDGSDTGQFDGIEDEVDFVIKNEGYKNTAEFMAKTIKFMYESQKFNSNQKKKRLTILCDIDEVVDNLTECVIKRYNEKYHDNLDFSSVTEYDLTKFTKPECKDIISEFCNKETISMMKTPDGAVEAVTDLMKNHNFYFVTATYPHNVGYKHEWLKKHFPLYNKDMLIVTCKKELINGDVLIDDYPKNLSNNVSLNLLFNKPWNAQIQDIKNFHRVYNWGNIMDHIKDLMEE